MIETPVLLISLPEGSPLSETPVAREAPDEVIP